MKELPLDIYFKMPDEMLAYKSNYGEHFSKKMYHFACFLLKKKNKKTGQEDKVSPITKEFLEQKLNENGIKLENNSLYDACYLWSKFDSIFESVENEKVILNLLRDYIEQKNMRKGFIFNEFYADCCYNGIPIDWEEMI